MAGDWIKIEHSLPGKPEVMELARLMDIDEMSVVGHLVCFWTWVDLNLSPECPHAKGTKRGLDRVAGRDGFVDAMLQVGWLHFDGENVTIPNYDHHLSQSAKKRAEEARKKKRQRSVSQKCPASKGTKTGQERDKTGDQRREEKRRDNNIDIEATAVSNPTTQHKPDRIGDELVIPEKLRTPAILKAVDEWFQHLELKDPGKVPPRNSPQMQYFWAEANRIGSDKILDVISFSIGNGYMRLIERPPNPQQTKRQSKAQEAQDKVNRLKQRMDEQERAAR